MDYTKLYHSIASDEEFQELPEQAQHLYFWMLAQPSLSYAGALDWRPARLTHLWPGATAEDIRWRASVLAESRYAFFDESTEEALIRSFIRHDGLLKQRNMAVSMRRKYHAISSSSLRRIVIWELHRIHADKPELAGWEKLADLLAKPIVDPSVDPKVDPSVYPPADPKVEGEPRVAVKGRATTTTTTTTTHAPQNPARGKPRTTAKKPDAPDTFDAFWDAYGHKRDRAAATKAYIKALAKTDAETLLAAAKAFNAHERSKPRKAGEKFPDYYPLAATWLNKERWDDELPSPTPAGSDIPWQLR